MAELIKTGGCFSDADFREVISAHIGFNPAAGSTSRRRSPATSAPMCARIDRLATDHVPMGCRSWRAWGKPGLFAFALDDAPVQGSAIGALREIIATRRGLGLSQASVPQHDDVAETRRFIATRYALGGLPMAPWGTVLTWKTEVKKVFAPPRDYVDLHGSVRANPAPIEGFEEAG